MNYDLKDIVTDVSFDIGTIHCKVRPITLRDEASIQRMLDGDSSSLFIGEELRLEPVCKVIYNQLADKSPFAAQGNVETYDDDGNKITEPLGGWRLMASMVTDEKTKLAILNAFNSICFSSRPRAGEEDTSKKKLK